MEIRNKDFFDFTLASVDGWKLIAHKVIVSALSIFFKNLLVNDKKSSFIDIHERNREWKSIVIFIYAKEIKVEQN